MQGASVQGKSHVERNTACQDAHDWQVGIGTDEEGAGGEEWLFAAIADGAGSSERSDEGAKEAVGAALEAVTGSASSGAFEEDAEAPSENLEDLLVSGVQEAISAVKELAEDEEARPSDFSSTLLLLAAGPSCAAAAQVGDGAVVYESSEGEYSLMTVPQNGEYHNQTTFITSEDAQSSIEVECVSGTPGRFALFTDGIEQVALEMSEMEPHAPFFEPLFQFSMQEDAPQEELKARLESFLESPRLRNRTEDDLTLLLASRIEQPAADALEEGKAAGGA